MTGLTHRQWRLSGELVRLVEAERALTERQLAERLCVSPAEVHRLTGMLIGRGKVERCGDYLILAAAPAQDTGGAA